MKMVIRHSDLEALSGVLEKKLTGLRPAFERIRHEVLEPMITQSWAKSGLISRSGALKKAVVAWHKAKSAGVKLKKRKDDKDRNLALAKAVMLQKGAKGHQYKKTASYKVRSKKGRVFMRHNHGAPWGDVKPRLFIPQRDQLARHRNHIENILVKYLQEGR